MVDSLFFCATLIDCHTPFVEDRAETSNTGAEAVKPDPGSSCEDYSRGGADVGDDNVESCGAAHPLHIPLVTHPLH